MYAQMLLKVNLQTNLKSMYECDRCGAHMTTKERHTFYHQHYTTGKLKYCDLCNKCFEAMERGIRNGKKKTQNTSKKISS